VGEILHHADDKNLHGWHKSTEGIEYYRRIYLRSWEKRAFFRLLLDLLFYRTNGKIHLL